MPLHSYSATLLTLNLIPGNGNAPINYVSKASPSKLPLVQGDYEAITNILSLLADYEGM